MTILVLLALSASSWISAQDSGEGALAEAAKAGEVRTLISLLNKGSDVNAKDNEGNTPLDKAADEDMKAILRQHGGKLGKEIEKAVPK